MSIGLGLDFDPYLPCNSHHVYRTPASAASSTTSGVTTSSQTTRTASTATADAQNQTNQTGTRIKIFLSYKFINKRRCVFLHKFEKYFPATTSTTTTSAPPTNATSAANAETANNNPFANLLQQILTLSAASQSPSTPISNNIMNNSGNLNN